MFLELGVSLVDSLTLHRGPDHVLTLDGEWGNHDVEANALRSTGLSGDLGAGGNR
jgi:hypothetical protein